MLQRTSSLEAILNQAFIGRIERYQGLLLALKLQGCLETNLRSMPIFRKQLLRISKDKILRPREMPKSGKTPIEADEARMNGDIRAGCG